MLCSNIYILSFGLQRKNKYFTGEVRTLHTRVQRTLTIYKNHYVDFTFSKLGFIKYVFSQKHPCSLLSEISLLTKKSMEIPIELLKDVIVFAFKYCALNLMKEQKARWCIPEIPFTWSTIRAQFIVDCIPFDVHITCKFLLCYFIIFYLRKIAHCIDTFALSISICWSKYECSKNVLLNFFESKQFYRSMLRIATI